MQIFSKNNKGTLLVSLAGELDEHSAEYARVKLDKLFAESDFKQIVIDFKELAFMDSSGVGMLIGRYKKMADKKVPIYLANPNNQMERIFKMSGLYKIMPKIS